MQSFLMAAGLGERLAPLTHSKPKSLVPVANRPVICRLLDLLQPYENKANDSFKLEEVFISLHQAPDDIKDIVGSGSRWNKNVHYSIEPEPEGTAGGIARIGKFLESDRFMLINADIVTDIDLAPAIEFHEKANAEMTLIMTNRYIDDPAMADNLIGVGRDGKIMANRAPDLEVASGIYTGIAICEPTVIERIPKGYSTLLDTLLIPLATEGSLFGYFAGGYWRDIGTVDSYMQANFDLISGLTKLPIDGRLIGENVWIDETAEIDFTVRIEEPVLIGKGVTIDRGCVIGPNVIIGDKCVIGPKVEISQSVIWNNCKIDGVSTIASAIVADNQRVTRGHRLNRVILHAGVSEAIFNI